MRLVVTEFVSLDGVMEDPGGSEKTRYGGWTFPYGNEEFMQFKLDELKASDAQLLGRVTYQGFAAAWPGRKDEAGFADKMNGMPKYVVSTTFKDSDATWNNSHVIRGDVAKQIRQLKQQPGGDLLVAGSAKLVNALMAYELVDEYRLLVYPLVLGEGKPLFQGGCHAPLKLVEVRPFQTGVILQRYVPDRK